MKDLLIVSKNDCTLFTTCNPTEVEKEIERAKEFYEKDLAMYRSHLINYPKMSKDWERGIKECTEKLESGFDAITWEEYEKRQREKWLSKEAKEISEEEYEYALNVLPPKCWIRNEDYSMFFVGECMTMTFYSQYLYDKKTKKYYSALTDIYDKSTWIDKLLNLR